MLGMSAPLYILTRSQLLQLLEFARRQLFPLLRCHFGGRPLRCSCKTQRIIDRVSFIKRHIPNLLPPFLLNQLLMHANSFKDSRRISVFYSLEMDSLWGQRVSMVTGFGLPTWGLLVGNTPFCEIQYFPFILYNVGTQQVAHNDVKFQGKTLIIPINYVLP